MIQLLWHRVFVEAVFHYLAFEIVICTSIASKLNFDTRSSLQEKFDAESSISVKELMSLNMSNNSSSSSAKRTSMSNLDQTIMYMLSFSESETSEASYFSEADVIKFLHWFHRLEKYHEIIDMKLIKMLSDYYECEKHSYVRA